MGVDWVTAVIAKETAYEEGYEAGKQSAVEQIFADLEREVRENSDDWCYQPQAELLDRLAEVKKKYGVK